MTSAKYIAEMIEREKHKEKAAKRLKENYARFMPKVVRDGINSIQRGLHDGNGEVSR